ncbi:hypothetical protein HBI56_158640 [Parastagonospora nodorum]|uniref:Uncharacterized protein n=1 Tax=Phaeosphaeria nodorum (strain SN15 / ATCC MYA-4574 / FGSC 10173) TaxID=321614 RepID=A0A7U2HVL2_PHANO|nr:hypothetical protein HBH56_189360 [Parastagonospora nodorum]QRC92323.1 hypothetical protein JI435_402260 [Parastagonospora nodorum SN15]KAH3925127.1 hypothetical protein HBH54_185170 [Parastagonospora nodorum]KAH3954306.1 hypothetical protein HBH53_024520 [Parastagonospora nodorum]KAH3963852.1 hypothetical protein HBH51_164360 [Parastagonospora nodorum]
MLPFSPFDLQCNNYTNSIISSANHTTTTHTHPTLTSIPTDSAGPKTCGDLNVLALSFLSFANVMDWMWIMTTMMNGFMFARSLFF